jgi:hypothetical protein
VFGLGARPGERQRIGDPRGWLRAQLQGEAPLLRAAAEGAPEAIAAPFTHFGRSLRPMLAVRRPGLRRRRNG